MKKRTALITFLIVIGLFIVFFGGYTAWNTANPEKTCAGCHEIRPSFASWQISSHREIACTECHGTALSNGWHSLTEKGNMVFSHFTEQKQNDEIHLTEEQVINTMDNCKACHQEEYKKWLSGGHSANYSHIFLDSAHNSMEQPYWDCFRCHGMHYEGNIYDLIEPVSNEGPWTLIDKKQADRPVITCLACHQIHTTNTVHKAPESFDKPEEIFYDRKKNTRNPHAGLYIRSDEMFLRADLLPDPVIYFKGKELRKTTDPYQRICIHCHAPNFRHEAGTEDDRTPAGVHEGLACMACHDTHSNDATSSCSQCHPAISNCGLDVTTMNTSYHDADSENNIHFVGCEDCHGENLSVSEGGSWTIPARRREGQSNGRRGP